MSEIQLEKLGTNYGGWYVPQTMNLNENSVIYSGGVGEDISFDLLLSDKYKSNIFLIDPTKRARIHYDEISKYYETGKWTFSGDIQKDYEQHIQNLTPSLNKMKFLNIGLWNREETLQFFKQANDKYVSQSFIRGMFSENYDIVEAQSVKNLMETHGHQHIDLMKLDIEGAEIRVLDQMLNDGIYPTILCVEFDLVLKGKDRHGKTKELIQRNDEGFEVGDILSHRLLNKRWELLVRWKGFEEAESSWEPLTNW